MNLIQAVIYLQVVIPSFRSQGKNEVQGLPDPKLDTICRNPFIQVTR